MAKNSEKIKTEKISRTPNKKVVEEIKDTTISAAGKIELVDINESMDSIESTTEPIETVFDKSNNDDKSEEIVYFELGNDDKIEDLQVNSIEDNIQKVILQSDPKNDVYVAQNLYRSTKCGDSIVASQPKVGNQGDIGIVASNCSKR